MTGTLFTGGKPIGRLGAATDMLYIIDIVEDIWRGQKEKQHVV